MERQAGPVARSVHTGGVTGNVNVNVNVTFFAVSAFFAFITISMFYILYIFYNFNSSRSL